MEGVSVYTVGTIRQAAADSSPFSFFKIETKNSRIRQSIFAFSPWPEKRACPGKSKGSKGRFRFSGKSFARATVARRVQRVRLLAGCAG